MVDRSFTFWANMKEAIDVYEGNPEYQYKMYDALTEYALYGNWPEDDGTMEAKNIIMFVQSMVPTIDKSSNYFQKCAEAGASGGRKPKITDEQLKIAVQEATKRKNGVPTRSEVCVEVENLFGIKIDSKTVSRRLNDEKKKEIAMGTLGQNRDINYVSGDKINVPGTLGQNNFVLQSQGQKDKINVPGDKIDMINVPKFFDF